MGALNNSKRGVWSTTELGRSMTAEDIAIAERHAAYLAQLREARKAKTAAGGDEEIAGDGDEAARTRDWKEQLIEQMLAISPDRFERLARRLLREAGFISATVTGRSGDGGIDGIGVYRLSLISFPVFFQCKRYKGSVGAGAVRDFRGAMSGRGDKGLLITTGSFTADAKQEATRDGAPPVDLIDGPGSASCSGNTSSASVARSGKSRMSKSSPSSSPTSDLPAGSRGRAAPAIVAGSRRLPRGTNPPSMLGLWPGRSTGPGGVGDEACVLFNAFD
jgi:hypothetical protein